MSSFLWLHGIQHSTLPCPSLSPRVCSNLCPLSQWCHWTISSSVAPFLLALNFSSIRIFFNELALPIRWPKYWSSTSAWVPPINIQVDFIQNWLAWSCCPRDSQESSPAPQLESINSSALSIPYSPTLTSLHDYWKNHSFNYMDLCQQSDVSAL